MLGDFILYLSEKIRQCFCIHNYKHKGKLDFMYEECTKCGRVKE